MTVTVRRVDTEADLEAAFDIRREVFVEGQGVSEEVEMDGRDGEATHFLAVEAWARDCGFERLELHAQTRVEEFYARLGYERTSVVFQEARIDHVAMEKELE